MSEKLPSVSGKVLISFLESLGYEVVRQRGSHVRLAMEEGDTMMERAQEFKDRSDFNGFYKGYRPN